MINGYLILALSLIAGATKGFCGKKISSHTNDLYSSLSANFLRMLLCIVIGIVLVLFQHDTSFMPSINLLLVSALSGISTACFVVTWLLSVKKNAYVMLELFLTMGVIIPLALSSLFFHEAVSIKECIGFAILTLGVYILSLYNNSLKGKIKLRDLLILLICGISNGVTDFSQKLFIKSTNNITTTVFNLYTYLFCALTLYIVIICLKKRKETSSFHFSSKVIIYISIMSVCLFAHSYFKTVCAGLLDAAKLYPLSQGGALILSTIMATIFFGEKISIKSITGTIIAFIGLLVINL